MGTERVQAGGSWHNFGLPANSRVLRGKVWPTPPGAKRVKEFRVYRYDPESSSREQL